MLMKFSQNNDEIEFLPVAYVVNTIMCVWVSTWNILFPRLGFMPSLKYKPRLSIYSSKYKAWFKSWKDYWFESGEKEALISIATARSKSPGSYQWNVPLLRQVVEDFGDTPVVVLYDWDMSKIGVLETRFPEVRRVQFYDDFIVLPYYTLSSALKVRSSIPNSMSKSLIIANKTVYPDTNNKKFT